MKQDKACSICGRVFSCFYPDLRVTCSRACMRVHLRTRNKRVPVEAIAAHKKACRQRVERMIRDQFGELTEREIEMFNHGVKIGYRRGYHYGKHREEAA